MKKLFIALFLLILTACTDEESTVQNSSSQESTTTVSIEPKLFGNAHRIGELVIAHDYSADVLVEQDGYDHVPKAFHLIIANQSDKAQDIGFLNDFVVMDSKSKVAESMMTIPMEHPSSIGPHEVLSLYILAYSPSFDYSGMHMLKLTDSVYFDIAPFAGRMNSEQAKAIERMNIQDNKGKQKGKRYNIDTFVTYDCPQLPVNAVCKKDANNTAYQFTNGKNPVELFYEEQQLNYARIQFGDDLLELYFEHEQLSYALWNEEVVTITQWIQICAMQLLQLQPLVQPITLNERVVDEQKQDETRINMTADEIEQYIEQVVRPAYDRSEKAINAGVTKPMKSDQMDIFVLDDLRKEIHIVDKKTYSAFYIADKLVFVLQIEPNRELVRYYFKNEQLIRILLSDGSEQDTQLLEKEKIIKEKIQGV